MCSRCVLPAWPKPNHRPNPKNKWFTLIHVCISNTSKGIWNPNKLGPYDKAKTKNEKRKKFMESLHIIIDSFPGRTSIHSCLRNEWLDPAADTCSCCIRFKSFVSYIWVFITSTLFSLKSCRIIHRAPVFSLSLLFWVFNSLLFCYWKLEYVWNVSRRRLAIEGWR